jgi:hypothetical protein
MGRSQPVVKMYGKNNMDRLELPLHLRDWKGRKYRRFSLEFPVTLKIQSGTPGSEIEAISKNVSVGGLLLRSALSLPTHSLVTFILSVHGEQAVRPIHLVGEGEIVRVEDEGGGPTFMIAVKCKTPVAQLENYLPA